jgi:hypothetical protein
MHLHELTDGTQHVMMKSHDEEPSRMNPRTNKTIRVCVQMSS